MAKVFVGNFSFSINDEQLKTFFAQAGEVVSAKVVTEGEGGRSRGFGFVEFASADDAAKAIQAYDGFSWEGRVIKVSADRGSEYGRGRRPFQPRHSEGGAGGGDEFRGPPPNRGGFFRAQPFDSTNRRRKKVDPFIENKKLVIDYKDPRLLRRFMSERGRILPRRMTGLTSAHQRQVTLAVKRAQFLALLPYVER